MISSFAQQFDDDDSGMEISDDDIISAFDLAEETYSHASTTSMTSLTSMTVDLEVPALYNCSTCNDPLVLTCWTCNGSFLWHGVYSMSKSNLFPRIKTFKARDALILLLLRRRSKEDLEHILVQENMRSKQTLIDLLELPNNRGAFQIMEALRHQEEPSWWQPTLTRLASLALLWAGQVCHVTVTSCDFDHVFTSMKTDQGEQNFYVCSCVVAGQPTCEKSFEFIQNGVSKKKDGCTGLNEDDKMWQSKFSAKNMRADSDSVRPILENVEFLLQGLKELKQSFAQPPSIFQLYTFCQDLRFEIKCPLVFESLMKQ